MPNKISLTNNPSQQQNANTIVIGPIPDTGVGAIATGKRLHGLHTFPIGSVPLASGKTFMEPRRRRRGVICYTDTHTRLGGVQKSLVLRPQARRNSI